MKQSVIISFKWIILLVLLIVPIVANAKDVTKDKKTNITHTKHYRADFFI